MKTKTFLKEIISHREIYGQDGNLEEAVNLIRDIPSVTLQGTQE
ncbi:hypothetical protein [Pedobacter miscanthi]|nr:hypothetical protein [Pedobacter miscanthi]